MQNKIEIWKPVVGYEGIYEVSSFGNVRSLDRIIINTGNKHLRKGINMKLSTNWRGYKQAYLTRVIDGKSVTKGILTHRLVSLAFIPNPDNKPQVNHINGIKDDNRVENLEWMTNKENINHGASLNLNIKAQGESHGLSKLSNADVKKIRIKFRKGIDTLTEFAANYKVSVSTMSKIISCKSYSKI